MMEGAKEGGLEGGWHKGGVWEGEGGTKWEKSTGSSITEGAASQVGGDLSLAKPPSQNYSLGQTTNLIKEGEKSLFIKSMYIK